MFAKRQRTYQHDEPNPEKRFRHNVAELFLDNQVSADRVQSLINDAKLANTKRVGDLAFCLLCLEGYSYAQEQLSIYLLPVSVQNIS